MRRWQVLKNGVPICVTSDINEAEKEYLKHDADEICAVDDGVDE